MPGQFEKLCDRGCGQKIIMQQTPEGWRALNPDFTPHKCNGGQPAGQKPDTITGLLTGFNSGSATFRVKGGATKTYALRGETFRRWESEQYAPDTWLEFVIDKDHYITQDRKTNAPEWGAELKDPTGGEIKQPFQKASELPRETPCTSPAASPAGEKPAASIEDQVRAIAATLPPSDRVGCRISLAGMVNSVIEMEKLTDHKWGGRDLENFVKDKALEMFLWCDGLTTQNFKGVN